jgi:hypothetical protein
VSQTPGRKAQTLRRALVAASVLVPVAALGLYAAWRSPAPPPGAVATATPSVPVTPAEAPPALSPAARDALLEQAAFWQAQHQPAPAIASLERLLRAAPDDRAALTLLAELQAGQGNNAAADAARARLRALPEPEPEPEPAPLAAAAPLAPAAAVAVVDAAKPAVAEPTPAAPAPVEAATPPPIPAPQAAAPVARTASLPRPAAPAPVAAPRAVQAGPQAIAQAQLRRDPANVQARLAAISDALHRGDRAAASALVQDGLALTPNDPQLWMASSDLAQANGDTARAMQDLQHARDLRRQQIDAPAPETAVAALAPEPPRAVIPLPTTPRGDAPQYQPDDDVLVPVHPLLDTRATDLPPPGAARPATPAAAAPSQTMQTADARPPAAQIPAAQIPASQIPAAQAAPQQGLGTLPSPLVTDDKLAREIDRSIAMLHDRTTASVQTGVSFGAHSGTSGLDRLGALAVPMEATYTPGGASKLKLAIAPTWLNAGSLGGANVVKFGSNALAASPGGGNQTASGVGLSVAYTWNDLTVDAGATPLGFRGQTAVGGLTWAPQLDDRTKLRITAERRAVTDSLLSYAGAADPHTGTHWGGVTANGGTVELEFGAGPADLHVGGGASSVTGIGVLGNTGWHVDAGGSTALMHTDTREARIGLELSYLGYSNNLRYFSLGQGGYFSPQNYISALIPLTYTARPVPKLSYELGAAGGIQSYHENASLFFPNDSALQAQFVAQQANPATAVAGVSPQYGARSLTSGAGNAHLSGDYVLAPGLHLNARVDFQHIGDFDTGSALLFARYAFGEAE